MPDPAKAEVWFVTGSQHLYGEEVLKTVAAHSQEIARALGDLSVPVVYRPVLTDPEAIYSLCQEANASPNCAGLILWMHTFSPAKMWIGGLRRFAKPICHLHTQFNRDLPWESIDMDFMNLNQAAHGDREAGHLHARLGLARKAIVGHWSDSEVRSRLDTWLQVVHGWHDLQGAKIARFGDNMRSVAVTEGDKVAAEVRFGFSVHGYGVGDLVNRVHIVSDAEIDELCRTYAESYDLAPSLSRDNASVREAARIELGLRAFLTEGGFKGLTTTFEDLHGLRQLPGIAAQRLMADGYGFGAEGDWKTAALLRFCKVASGNKATSFMEDYTYHLDPANPLVLGAHMLEICPTIAAGKPKLEVHPLGIGGKEDPARLVFSAKSGPAMNASLIDLGHRFRLVVNEVDATEPPATPKLPVAKAVWKCRPDFKTAAACWIHAGGAHHTAYSHALTSEHLRDFAEIAGIECLVIDADTKLESFRNELRWNEASYRS